MIETKKRERIETMNIVAICSGGLDSTVMYYYLKAQSSNVIALNFSYGAKHNMQERRSAMQNIPIAKHIDIDLSFLKSSLLQSSDEPIPHGRYNADNMRSTVVPFRNGIFLSYAVAYAESIGFNTVALGAHWGDHTIYPDCTPDFIATFCDASALGTYTKVQIIAPFANKVKADIVRIGHDLNIDEIMWRSWTCYEGRDIHCGVCGACDERKEAFKQANVEDHTIYAI